MTQSDSSKEAGKAKLNLSKCNLDDQMVIFLVEALSEAPMISKLDLSGNNLTDNSAVRLVRLLINQARNVRQTDPLDRFAAIYLSEVLILNNRVLIENRILDDVKTVTAALQHANVKNTILQLSKKYTPLTADAITKICEKILTKKIDQKKINAVAKRNLDPSNFSGDFLSYAAMEEMIIQEMVLKKLLPSLNEMQQKQIKSTIQQSIVTRKILSELDTSDSEPSSLKRNSDGEPGPDSGKNSMIDFKARVDEVLKKSGWEMEQRKVEEEEEVDMDIFFPRTPLREYGTAPFLLYRDDSCSDDDDDEEKYSTESEGGSEHGLCESEGRSESEEWEHNGVVDGDLSNAEYGNGGYDTHQACSSSYQGKKEGEQACGHDSDSQHNSIFKSKSVKHHIQPSSVFRAFENNENNENNSDDISYSQSLLSANSWRHSRDGRKYAVEHKDYEGDCGENEEIVSYGNSSENDEKCKIDKEYEYIIESKKDDKNELNLDDESSTSDSEDDSKSDTDQFSRIKEPIKYPVTVHSEEHNKDQVECNKKRSDRMKYDSEYEGDRSDSGTGTGSVTPVSAVLRYDTVDDITDNWRGSGPGWNWGHGGTTPPLSDGPTDAMNDVFDASILDTLLKGSSHIDFNVESGPDSCDSSSCLIDEGSSSHCPSSSVSRTTWISTMSPADREKDNNDDTSPLSISPCMASPFKSNGQNQNNVQYPDNFDTEFGSNCSEFGSNDMNCWASSPTKKSGICPVLRPHSCDFSPLRNTTSLLATGDLSVSLGHSLGVDSDSVNRSAEIFGSEIDSHLFGVQSDKVLGSNFENAAAIPLDDISNKVPGISGVVSDEVLCSDNVNAIPHASASQSPVIVKNRDIILQSDLSFGDSESSCSSSSTSTSSKNSSFKTLSKNEERRNSTTQKFYSHDEEEKDENKMKNLLVQDPEFSEQFEINKVTKNAEGDDTLDDVSFRIVHFIEDTGYRIGSRGDCDRSRSNSPLQVSSSTSKMSKMDKLSDENIGVAMSGKISIPEIFIEGVKSVEEYSEEMPTLGIQPVNDVPNYEKSVSNTTESLSVSVESVKPQNSPALLSLVSPLNVEESRDEKMTAFRARLNEKRAKNGQKTPPSEVELELEFKVVAEEGLPPSTPETNTVWGVSPVSDSEDDSVSKILKRQSISPFAMPLGRVLSFLSEPVPVLTVAPRKSLYKSRDDDSSLFQMGLSAPEYKPSLFLNSPIRTTPSNYEEFDGLDIEPPSVSVPPSVPPSVSVSVCDVQPTSGQSCDGSSSSCASPSVPPSVSVSVCDVQPTSGQSCDGSSSSCASPSVPPSVSVSVCDVQPTSGQSCDGSSSSCASPSVPPSVSVSGPPSVSVCDMQPASGQSSPILRNEDKKEESSIPVTENKQTSLFTSSPAYTVTENRDVLIRSRSNSGNSLPTPRTKTILKPKDEEDTLDEKNLDLESEKQMLKNSKINILKTTRRPFGSSSGLEGDTSLSDKALPSSAVSTYEYSDYANYAEGEEGDIIEGNFFADDNPLSHVTAKLESGSRNRQYEFSGPLGDKIKESLKLEEDISSEFTEYYYSAPLCDTVHGSSRSQEPHGQEDTTHEMSKGSNFTNWGRDRPVLGPQNRDRRSQSMPAEYTEGIGYIRKLRADSYTETSTSAQYNTMSSHNPHDQLEYDDEEEREREGERKRGRSPSPLSIRSLTGPRSRPTPYTDSKINFNPSGGTLKQVPRSKGMALERNDRAAAISSGRKIPIIPTKPIRLPGSGQNTMGYPGTTAILRGFTKGNKSNSSKQSRQLWSQATTPPKANTNKSFGNAQEKKNRNSGQFRAINEKGNKSRDQGMSRSSSLKLLNNDVRALSSTIYIPENEKFKHSSRLSGVSKIGDISTEKNTERDDFLLDLKDQHLTVFDAAMYHLYPMNKLSLVCVLILRNNELTDLKAMRLKEMTCLTDLDLAHNLFVGSIPPNVFPKNIERLDLSNNGFDNFTALVTCVNLRSVNLSNNKLKNIAALPTQVDDLDLSWNLIHSPLQLRLLSLSPSIKTLRIVGNPIGNLSAICRVIVCSVLPSMQQLDDIVIPGCGVRRKGPGRGTPNTEPKEKFSVSKIVQTKSDQQRHAIHAMKIREAERVQTNVNKQIRTLAHTTVIGQQATELMVRRLTWVPPSKSSAASFFEPTVTSAAHDSTVGTQSGMVGNVDPGSGLWTGTTRAPNPTLHLPSSAKPLNRRNSSSNIDNNLYSNRSCTEQSVRPRSAPLTSTARRPRASESNLISEQSNHSCSQSCLEEGGEYYNNTSSSFNMYINTSRTSDTSSFSTFGPSKSATKARSNSAPSSYTSRVDTFKAFAAHSELPSSPSKSKKEAVFVVNKWLHDSVQELGKAAVVLGLAFWMTEQPHLEYDSHINFSAAINRIAFLREATLETSSRSRTHDLGVNGHLTRLREALAVLARRGGEGSAQGNKGMDDYYYLLAAVEAARGNMDSFASVMLDVKRAVIEANKQQSQNIQSSTVLHDLRKELESIMCATKGRIVNELILAPFGCQLLWHENENGNENEKISDPTRLTSYPLDPMHKVTQNEREGDGDEERGHYTPPGSMDRPPSPCSTISTTNNSTTYKRSTSDPNLNLSGNKSSLRLTGATEKLYSHQSTTATVPATVTIAVAAGVSLSAEYTQEMLDTDTIMTINRLNSGSALLDIPQGTQSKRPVPSPIPVPTSRTQTKSIPKGRVVATKESDTVVAKRMDPVIYRLKQKLGLKTPITPTALGPKSPHIPWNQSPNKNKHNFGSAYQHSTPVNASSISARVKEMKKSTTQTPTPTPTSTSSRTKGASHTATLSPTSAPPLCSPRIRRTPPSPSIPPPQKHHFSTFIASKEVKTDRKMTSPIATKDNKKSPHSKSKQPPALSKNGNCDIMNFHEILQPVDFSAQNSRNLTRRKVQDPPPEGIRSENEKVKGCSFEFLTGDHRSVSTAENDVDKVLNEVKAVISNIQSTHAIVRNEEEHSARNSSAPVQQDSLDIAILDYNDIYTDKDFVLEITDSQKEEFENYREVSNRNSTTPRLDENGKENDDCENSNFDGVIGVYSRGEGRGEKEKGEGEGGKEEGGEEGGDDGCSPLNISTCGSGLSTPISIDDCHKDKDDVLYNCPSGERSPFSNCTPRSTGSKILPSVHGTPSFGFTNSYSEIVPLGRKKLTRLLTHSNSAETLGNARVSEKGDDMFYTSPVLRREKPLVSSAITVTSDIKSDIKSDDKSDIKIDNNTDIKSVIKCNSKCDIKCDSLMTPMTSSSKDTRVGISGHVSPEFFSPTFAANIDNYDTNPMRNSLAENVAKKNDSPRTSRNMPSFLSNSLSLASSSEDSEFISVSARRDSLNKANKEIQKHKAVAAALISNRKEHLADTVYGVGMGPESGAGTGVDIRGYNSEAAMAVKSRLNTPVKRRKTMEDVSAEIADRLGTLGEPSLPLGLL